MTFACPGKGPSPGRFQARSWERIGEAPSWAGPALRAGNRNSLAHLRRASASSDFALSFRERGARPRERRSSDRHARRSAPRTSYRCIPLVTRPARSAGRRPASPTGGRRNATRSNREEPYPPGTPASAGTAAHRAARRVWLIREAGAAGLDSARVGQFYRLAKWPGRECLTLYHPAHVLLGPAPWRAGLPTHLPPLASLRDLPDPRDAPSDVWAVVRRRGAVPGESPEPPGDAPFSEPRAFPTGRGWGRRGGDPRTAG